MSKVQIRFQYTSNATFRAAYMELFTSFAHRPPELFLLCFGRAWWLIQAVLCFQKTSTLCISSPTIPCVFPLLCKQLKGQLLLQTLCVRLSWACTRVPWPALGSIEPVLHWGVLCAVFLLRKAMQNTQWSSPLEHLVLQLCNDSHQGHTFFSKLRVASSAAPQGDTQGSPFTEPWVLGMGEKWD